MEKRTWHIIYVDKKYLSEQAIERCKYEYGVEVVVPMLWVLRKVARGKNNYAEVPYLFNMGFLRLSKMDRGNIDFLTKLKRDVPMILGYLRDTMLPKEGFNFAMVSTAEVNRVIRDANNTSIYDNIEEVVKVGDMVEMTGYPWSGLIGEIVSLSSEKETAKVKIVRDSFNITVDVPYYNLFYTQYTHEIEGGSEEMREESIEDISPARVNKIFASVSINLEEDGED